MVLLIIFQLIAAGIAFGALMWRPGWLRPIVAVFAISLALIFSLNTHLFRYDGELASFDQIAERTAMQDDTVNEECDRMLVFVDQLDLVGSITEGQMPVRTALWDRLPANVQSAVTKCASLRYNAGRPLEVVRQ